MTTRCSSETVRHIDTATGDGNEDQAGAAIGDSGVGRENVFITTKCPPARASRIDGLEA
jgi:2,5-diketo-D-gluconate reductase A